MAPYININGKSTIWYGDSPVPPLGHRSAVPPRYPGRPPLPIVPCLGRQPDVPPPALPGHLPLQPSPAVEPADRQVTGFHRGPDRARRLGLMPAIGEPARLGEHVHVGEYPV